MSHITIHQGSPGGKPPARLTKASAAAVKAGAVKPQNRKQ